MVNYRRASLDATAHASAHASHHSSADSINMGMVGHTDLLHVRLESSLVISHIFDDPLGAIWLVEHVSSLGHVSVAHLPGLLVVAGLVVLHSVVVLVVGDVLQGVVN